MSEPIEPPPLPEPSTPSHRFDPPYSWLDHPGPVRNARGQGRRGHPPADRPLLSTEGGCRVYTVLTTLVIVTRRHGWGLENTRRMLPRSEPGCPSRRRAPEERDSGERKSSILSPSHRPPTSSPVSRPGRAEPRRLLLLPAGLVALIRKMLGNNCRTADRVCRPGFKQKLPVAGREGCDALSVGGHVVRNALPWATPSGAAMLYGRSESRHECELPGGGCGIPQVWAGEGSDALCRPKWSYESLASYSGLGTETRSRLESMSQSFSLFGL